ncbi:GntR family transcriptional regulator [Glutamicibacter sp. MNS18]|uniref:GntR family transcriptional regulator n=1 Tax=Glutamicibacter sp. MNS18 TaxID=2989817 RepID=UPI002235D84C|nr:GntR family transcriptional regulator [Glutamicibacter sp. MNS18]MCW4466660.1 GntR family transcriptional regulator [Glutamicibacter sp. MNS18]
MPIRKLEPNALVGDQAFTAIHDAIMNGDFKAGYRLRIRDLAEGLGTSVMPVREAIRRLEEIGLVETVPYRGAVVKGFTAQELEHVYSTRRLLEIEASRLGALNASSQTIQRMTEEFGLMKNALSKGDVAGYLDRDEALLEEFYAAAGNPVLSELIGNLWKRCRSYKLVGAQEAVDAGVSPALWHYQAELIEAVRAHDAQRAVTATAASLDEAASRIEDAMNAMSGD